MSMGHQSENLKSVQSLSFQEQTFRGLYFGEILPSCVNVSDPLAIPKSARQIYKNTYMLKNKKEFEGLFNWALKSGAPLAEDVQDINNKKYKIIIHYDASKDKNIITKYNSYVNELLKSKISYKFTSFEISEGVRTQLPPKKFKTYKYFNYSKKDNFLYSSLNKDDIILSMYNIPKDLFGEKRVTFINTRVDVEDPIVAFAIPSGGGKSTMVDKWSDMGAIDVDDLVPNTENLNKLRRVALDTGDWEEYLIIYNKTLINSWERVKKEKNPKIVFIHNKYTAHILGIRHVFKLKMPLDIHIDNVARRDPSIFNEKLVESSWNSVDTDNIFHNHLDKEMFILRKINEVIDKNRIHKTFHLLRKAIDYGINSDTITFIQVYHNAESLLSSHGNTVTSMDTTKLGVDVSLKIHTNELARFLKMTNQQWRYFTRSKPAYIVARCLSNKVTFTNSFNGLMEDVFVNGQKIDVSGHVVQSLIAMAFPDFSFFGSPNLYPDHHSFFSGFIINQTNVTYSLEPTFQFPAYHSWIETYSGVVGAISGISLMLKSGVKTHKKHIIMALMYARKLIKSIKFTNRTMIGAKKEDNVRQFIEQTKI